MLCWDLGADTCSPLFPSSPARSLDEAQLAVHPGVEVVLLLPLQERKGAVVHAAAAEEGHPKGAVRGGGGVLVEERVVLQHGPGHGPVK